VLLEVLMLSCTIDAKENLYVIVTDIPGALLHVDKEGIVHMILEGEIAELIVKIELETYKNTYGIIEKESQCCMYN